MKKSKQQISQSRRRFLRDAGISGGIAAVAVSAPSVAVAQSDEETGAGEKQQEGYRLTSHILAYYKSAAS
jgi:hypothetical protein